MRTGRKTPASLASVCALPLWPKSSVGRQASLHAVCNYNHAGQDVLIGNELIVRDCIVLPHKQIFESCHNEIVL